MLPEIKKDTVRRMKIAQGQVAKVLKMIEDEEYCPDILTQSLAAQNAMKQVDVKLLESHMKTCVKKQMASGKTNKAVEEIIKVFQLARKNS